MITAEIYKSIRSAILLKLDENLSKDLFYHSIHHTIDVEMQAERIAAEENICDETDVLLLKTACLYHDSGFLFSYNGHELAGCNFAKKELAVFGITEEQLEVICGLIMATKLPQTPLTKMQEIICDADLDYLGRDDFYPISNSLFREVQAKNFVHSEHEWNLIQINFFKGHQYFTDTSNRSREKQKLEHLRQIEAVTVGV